MFATVGCHPTRSAEFDKYSSGAEEYLKALENVIKDSLSGKGRVVAVGECGLGMRSVRSIPSVLHYNEACRL